MSDLKRSFFSGIEFRSIGPDEIEGIASNATLDRMGDILEPGGMKPVGPRGLPFLAGHNDEIPIGRAWLRKAGGNIVARIKFAPEGASSDADSGGIWQRLASSTDCRSDSGRSGSSR
jgi:hypothetical protein